MSGKTSWEVLTLRAVEAKVRGVGGSENSVFREQERGMGNPGLKKSTNVGLGVHGGTEPGPHQGCSCFCGLPQLLCGKTLVSLGACGLPSLLGPGTRLSSEPGAHKAGVLTRPGKFLPGWPVPFKYPAWTPPQGSIVLMGRGLSAVLLTEALRLHPSVGTGVSGSRRLPGRGSGYCHILVIPISFHIREVRGTNALGVGRGPGTGTPSRHTQSASL